MAHVPTQVAHVKVRARLPAVVVCVRVLVDLQARPISTLAPARIIPTAEKWGFAEKALRHAEDMLDVLVHIAKYGESESARVTAADKVLDRAMGKAPQHIDVTALRHTDIVYQSAEELRQELRKALEEEGVPRALMDLTVEPVEESDE